MVKRLKLSERLKALGFPLLEPEENEDANLTLADVVKSRDLRLWEGFPILLVNSASVGLFDYNKIMGHLKKSADKSCFKSLVAMSLALYQASRVKFSWADALYNSLGADMKKECSKLADSLKNGVDFSINGYKMSAQRVKAVFGNYSAKTGSKLNDLLAAKDEFGLEHALSQVFSPKQKELFLKKLKGEKLTKTENEYFSRAVKKKVAALANADLHRLSQKLLE